MTLYFRIEPLDRPLRHHAVADGQRTHALARRRVYASTLGLEDQTRLSRLFRRVVQSLLSLDATLAIGLRSPRGLPGKFYIPTSLVPAYGLRPTSRAPGDFRPGSPAVPEFKPPTAP